MADDEGTFSIAPEEELSSDKLNLEVTADSEDPLEIENSVETENPIDTEDPTDTACPAESDNGVELDDWEKDLQDVLEKGEELISSEQNGHGENELNSEEWEAQLDEVLSEGVDYGKLRSLCLRRTRFITASRRLGIWKVALGLSRKSDSMQAWDGSFDCLDRDAIEEQCVRQVEQLPEDYSQEERDAICTDMRSVITVYSKSTGQRFRSDGGWPELLYVISMLKPSRKDAFNILYTVLQKYVPKNCRNNGKPFHLFRLLLLYHDVGLCNFLDTCRVSPEMYLQKWLRALFSASCSLPVVRAMWDIYFLEADPFLVFFLALVMLMNAKEMLMDGTQISQGDLAESISLFPSELGEDDLEDFCLLAQHYASLTPQSFRMDYHAPLFGPMKSTPQSTALSHVLCLPIGLTELLTSLQQKAAGIGIYEGPVSVSSFASESTAVSYFLVDCRPLDQYQRGRLLFCHHLDAELMLKDVGAFHSAVDKLQQVHDDLNEGEDHWCFIGSGREEEDQYMHMAVAHVLQRNVNYVSVARGGYSTLKAQLWDRAKDLMESDDGLEPEVLTSDVTVKTAGSAPVGDRENGRPSREDLKEVKEAAVKKMEELAGRVRGAVKEKKAAVRQRATDMQKRFAESKQAKNRQTSESLFPKSPPAFSIDGEDDMDREETLVSMLAQGRTPDVNTSVFCALPQVTRTFKCSELKEDGYMVAASLVLTDDTLYGLRDLSSRPSCSEVYHQMPLSNLVKITSKKKHPELLTFHIGTVDKVHMCVRYLVPQAKSACAALKTAILAEVQRNTSPATTRRSSLHSQ